MYQRFYENLQFSNIINFFGNEIGFNTFTQLFSNIYFLHFYDVVAFKF